MKYQYHLPDLGEGITESEIMSWDIKEGETVNPDQTLFEVQNDKTTIEVPSPVKGNIKKIYIEAGSIAKVGELLLEIDVDETWAKKANFKIESTQSSDSTVIEETPSVEPVVTPSIKETITKVKAIPRVRRYAREKNVELSDVTGTGKNGSITIEDIDGFLAQDNPNAMVTAETIQVEPIVEKITKPMGGQSIPMSAMRKATMKAMVKSASTIPSVTVFADVDVTKLINHRDQYKEYAASKGINLTYTAYFVKAAAAMVKQFPIFNATVDSVNEAIVYKEAINIGVATNTESGLYVPNIKNADAKNLFEIAQEITKNTEDTVAGRLSAEAMRNGSFTVTNVGGSSKDSVYSTPIINYPEVGIVGTSRIAYETVVDENRTIRVAPIMKISFAFDHRIIDGIEAQNALDLFKSVLADPNLILLEG